MYGKYKNIPILTRNDKMDVMQIELLVLLNEKLDKILNSEQKEIEHEINSLPKTFTSREKTREELEAMTKPVLIEMAKEKGLNINPRDRKEAIINAIVNS